MTRKDNDETKKDDDKEKRGEGDKKMDEEKKSKLNDRFVEFGEQPEMKEMLKMNKDKMYEDMEKMSDKFKIFIQMPDGEEKDKLTENIRKMFYGESEKMDDEQRSKAKEQYGMMDEDLDEMENYAKQMSYGMDMMENKFGEWMKNKYPSEAEEMVDDMYKFKNEEYRNMFREKAIDKNGKCTEEEKKQNK